jgi:hypothetical protein
MVDFMEDMRRLLGEGRDVTFRDVIDARALGREALNEASLGRVFQHMQKTGEKSFAILTSWRQNLGPEKNKASLAALQGSIRSLGLGVSKLLGHWREEGQPKATAEPSLFVPGMSKVQALKLGRDYDQDAVIYAGPDTEGEVTLVFKDGSEQKIGKFHPGRIAQAYSSVKGKTFTFEGFEYPAQTFVEGMIEQYSARDKDSRGRYAALRGGYE